MSPLEVKNIFEEAGVSVSEWARVRGFSSGLVYQVLNGERKCQRGQSHRIAVALGLKRGEDVNINQFNEKLLEKIKGKEL